MNHPIFVREMQASMRLARTPWLLMVLVLVLGLGLAAAGAIEDRGNPAALGQGLYQAFFSLGFLVAALFGPATSSGMVAAEREGRTWESLLLSGLPARQIAKEKFLAGFASSGLYIIALSPVAGLSFLFGGVSASELGLGFGVLFAVAAMASLLGTALSAVWKQQRGAITATLAASIALGGLLFMLFGFAASFAMHDKWRALPEGHPIWLPLAWVRAPFGVDYVLLLVCMPVILFGAAGWFLYETTVAHMKEDSDDRASGYRRWFCWSTPALGFAVMCPVLATPSSHSAAPVGVVGALLFFAFLFGASLLLGGEPVNASRRLLARLARGGARGLLEGAPGLVTTLGMFLVVSLGTVAALSVGVVMSFAWKGANVGDTGAVLVCLGYGGAFFVFSTGFLALLRARGASSLLSRLVTIGVLAAASLGPPIFALIVKATTDVPNTDDLLPLMAPSPLFAGVMCEAVGHTYRAAAQTQLAVGAFCMACWTALGAVLFLIARARAASAARAAL